MSYGKQVYIQFLLNGKPISKKYMKEIRMAIEELRNNEVLHVRLLKLIAKSCVEVEEKKLMFRSRKELEKFIEECKELRKYL